MVSMPIDYHSQNAVHFKISLQQALKLCLVTTPTHQPLETYLSFTQEVIEGGVTMVQFRDKQASSEIKYKTALALQVLLKKYNIPLIINDDLELAASIHADGVHLGQSDCLPFIARQRLGAHKIIGLSIETLEQLHVANTLDCIDYIGASAVFPSITKLDCKTIWGLTGLKQIVQHSHHPVIGIGGITTDNVSSVIEQGAAGVAIVSALHQAQKPKQMAALFIEKINQGAQHV